MKKLYKCTHNLYIRVVEYFRYDLRKGKVRMNMRKKLVTAAAVILSAAAFICKPIKADAMAQARSWRNYLTETGYYYEQLTTEEKKVYRLISQAMVTTGSSMYAAGTVRDNFYSDLSWSELQALFNRPSMAINLDHPALIDRVNNAQTDIVIDGDGMDAVLSQAAGIASSVSNLNQVDKVKYFHDYVISQTTYNTNAPNAHNVYGVFKDKKAVCDGYAESLSLLCHMANIECVKVSGWGFGEYHAWNAVRLDGEWYEIDATWDDAGDGLTPYYDYFLLTSAQMDAKYHIHDRNELLVEPVANGTKYAYAKAPAQTSPQNGVNDVANAGNNDGVYENAPSPTEEPGQGNAKNESFHDNNYKPAAGNSLMAESGEEVVVSGNEAVITKGQGSSIPAYVTVNGNRCEVVEIGDGAYIDNKNLRNITIPKGVRRIGKKAFYGCSNLRKIKYAGKNVKKIGKKAFSNISRNATSSVPKKVYDKYVRLIKKSKPVKGMKYKKR